ncbi:aldehyde dehydrogenase family protein [Nakamurella sp. PAMC28650]|uniref:aldehyde dehydrogenase family protein n=1 Tax=Nakamurella sp. PAMC28650 TaxID=2762325 RepID=UPI00164D0A3B|nr:aldehyde dehydrogenase family protein [Nakamurella sp. PAMC28650]QNK81162.1 aldehyde dehydrogenase [Nakamurella sp. PAMC28650]
MTAQIFEQSIAQADAALAELTAGAARWSALPLSGRRELLQALSVSVAADAEQWVSVAAAYKGLDATSPLLGEEWTSGPYAVLTSLSALTESLRALEAGGSPVDGVELGTAPGGRVTVKALPYNIFDVLLLNGFSADVWMQPGVSPQQVRSGAGLGQRHPTVGGGVGVVLGAGNITSIPLLDVVYELFAHNRVTVLKLNPVTTPILPVFDKAFAPLIEAGFLRIVTGAADVGQFLVNHPSVTHVHITGSAASHDAIVFGTGIEGEARRAAVRVGAAEPLLHKEITSELGGVSPTIIVPGKWSKADLRFQAEHVATQRLHNGGYNCIAGQVVILSSDWPQREAFLTQLRSALSRAPHRAPYYPGSDQRVAAAKAGYPAAEALDGGRLLITGVRSAAGEKALNTEYFAPVLAVTELPGSGLAFLRAAVAVANDDLVGTLGVNVIAHPRTLRAAGAAFDETIADLRYGAVAVNAWTGFGFLTARATWGAFPGHILSDVQSGIGIVHNAFLLDRAERTVVRGPFRPSHRSLGAGEFTLSPKPPWFVTNRTQATTGRRLTQFAANPGWAKLPGIFASALRG